MKKRLFLSLLFSICAITGFSQIYVSTGSNVNVRKGPGKNYSVQFQLQKGDKVYFTGKKQNGFMKVTNISSSPITWQGWVSERYLKQEQRDQSNVSNDNNRISRNNSNTSNHNKDWIYGRWVGRYMGILVEVIINEDTFIARFNGKVTDCSVYSYEEEQGFIAFNSPRPGIYNDIWPFDKDKKVLLLYGKPMQKY